MEDFKVKKVQSLGWGTFKRTTASHEVERKEGGELATYSKLSLSLYRMWWQKEEECV